MDRKNVYSARDVRQGCIVLDTPLRRAIFIVGLAGVALVGVILVWAA